MKNVFLLTAVLCSVTLVPSASAHVTLLYPVGGETFVPGNVLRIQWRLDVQHGEQDWDLYFSSDGGATWEAIQLNLPVSSLAYQWTIPDIETTQGRIRIVQDNSTGVDYEGNCQDFSIAVAATAIHGSTPSHELPELFASYPNPFTTSTLIEFTLPYAAHVVLEVFDVTGVKVATVIGATRPPGRHHVRWQPAGLAPGVYLYRFEVGGRVQIGKLLLLN